MGAAPEAAPGEAALYRARPLALLSLRFTLRSRETRVSIHGPLTPAASGGEALFSLCPTAPTPGFPPAASFGALCLPTSSCVENLLFPQT